MSAMCMGIIDKWRRALVAWFAKLADKTVLSLYLDNPVSTEQPPPAKRFKKLDKRKYVVVPPEAKWAILVDARETRTNPTTVLALRSKLEECGCHPDSADAWMRKEQAMYMKRAAIGLSIGVGHAIR